jgi:DNA mismatch endonuclease (patch repair protein)
MQATRQRNTPGELALRLALSRMGLRYRVDASLPGTRRRADVAFARAKVAVFVDGCFWHGCPEHGTWPKANAAWWRRKLEGNVARDRDTDAQLSALGWCVFRIWEHQNPVAAAASIATAVRSRQTKFGVRRG